ncbi:MAG: IS110 family transposase [Patescibacteria group bacterium]|nr:IS110 family transposase [Patescibacteria group bacterium]
MNQVLNTDSIVVGVDVHKYGHTAAVVDCFGQEIGNLNFSNDLLSDFCSWMLSLAKKENIIVALEDANGYGVFIVKALTEAKFTFRYVPAILTERDRKRSTHHDKSDIKDAKRVAKVILTKYEETLPARESIATKQEVDTAVNFDLLLSERRDIVNWKSILKNQLHALLHQCFGDHYKDNYSKAFGKKACILYIKELKKKIKKDPEDFLAQSTIRRIERLILLTKQLAVIDKKINSISENVPDVKSLSENIHGCGVSTAATIVSQVYTIKRFLTKAKFAKYAGIAPTEKSSGQRGRLYTSPFGNRILNKAIHRIALSQISGNGDPRGKLYYQKKLAEGKTKLWALRCLKRQLSNRVYHVLKHAD